MRNDIIRGVLLGILLLGFTFPGIALAGDAEKGCSNLGTWFGVLGPDSTTLAGFFGTVTGKSEQMGTNNLEFPTFDPKLTQFGLDEIAPYKDAVGLTSFRGNWKRTGGNTFDYTFMGFALDASNMPVYIAKVSGQVILEGDCQYQNITAVMETYWPYDSPFDDAAIHTLPMGQFFAYRADVDLPY
jgi:hypothetical protein